MTPEDRLGEVKHLVVLMMENRSFDHMLGYLSLPDTPDRMPDVRGLEGPPRDVNEDDEGGKHPIHEFDARDRKLQRRGEALRKPLDPDHSPDGVRIQISDDMGGFVKAYARSRKPEEDGTPFPPELWNVPMGYYTWKDLPLYDHLAHNYCVCDAWYSSIPGDTWPNRCYALTGGEDESVWKKSHLFQVLKKKLSILAKLQHLPLYDRKAFTRHLDRADWRWYSYDPSTLRAMDSEYRKLHDLKLDNFAWFKRRQLAPAKLLEEDLLGMVSPDSFLDDAANNRLRKVSWIDPNFVDANVLDPNSNDDHPPTDILAGQALVFDVYDALRKSDDWNDTVLVITYDEHGGFYDHCSPPAVSDRGRYDTLGVRVPALIVGPRVKRFVCHEPPDGEEWDHTALIRSILHVCGRADAIASIEGRVSNWKAHIGHMLEDAPRGDDLPTEALHPDVKSEHEETLNRWREDARTNRFATAGSPSNAPDGAGQELVITDFQNDFLKFALAMREAGLGPHLTEEQQKAQEEQPQ